MENILIILCYTSPIFGWNTSLSDIHCSHSIELTNAQQIMCTQAHKGAQYGQHTLNHYSFYLRIDVLFAFYLECGR